MPSGSTSVKVTNWNTLKFTWEEVGSTQLQGNVWKLTLRWKMQLIATSDGYISSSASKAWSVTIGGENFGGTNTIGISNNSTKTLASGTVELLKTRTSATDNVFEFNYSFSQQFDMNFDGWIGTKSGSGTGEVPLSAIKSTLTAGNGTLGTAQTLTIARQVSGMTHTITYKCGSASGTIASNTTSTSVSWTPPLSLAQQNTTGTSVSATLTLTTYLDGANIGSNSYTIALAIPASVKPTCSMTLEDVSAVDDIYGSPVQNLSKIKIVITGTGSQGSTISSYKVTVDGKTYTGSTVTTALLQTAGNSPVVATVTDSRGRQGTTSYTMNVQAYTAPAITEFKVIRCNQDGTENDRGDYTKVTFSALVSSMGSKNTAAYVLRYKKSSATTYTEQTLTAQANKYTVTDASYIIAASGNESYDIEIEVKDRHHTTLRTSSVSTAFTLMNWGADGTSIGIGKVAEKAGTVQIGLDVEFLGALTGTIFDTILPVGSVVIRYDHISPSTLYPGTTWERITNSFLWATTSGGIIGQTGGESEVTLTESQLPAHSHGSVYSQHADESKKYAWYSTAGSSVAYGPVETGGGQAHNNMPPYIQVSVWRRTN